MIPDQNFLFESLTSPLAERRKKLWPYPTDDMHAWKVGRAVGDVRQNAPALIEEIEDCAD